MKLFLLLFLGWSTLAFSQESVDVGFLKSQKPLGAAMALPISVDSDGNISFLNDQVHHNFVFKPTLHLGFSFTTIRYSQPVVSSLFDFYPVHNEFGWIEIKRSRLEGGLGLSAIMSSVFTVGLAPYKGAWNSMIRHKNSKDEKSPSLVSMPKALSSIKNWNEGDFGTFQTYGGVIVRAGVSAGFIELANVAIGIQNQFLIEITKQDNNLISLKLSEEGLNTRRFRIGPVISRVSLGQFDGKRLSVEFKLNLNDPLHSEMYKKAINGDITFIQDNLPTTQQMLVWEGKERELYYGIPALVGKSQFSSHYDLEESGVETELDIKGASNIGYLTPLRNHQKFIYQTEKGMALIWGSEMNKVDRNALERNFLSKGRILGIKGFDRSLPENQKFGSVVSQIGIHISRTEVEALKSADLELVPVLLKEKCLAEKLSCKQDKKITKIMTQFKNLIKRPWGDMKGELGKLLMKEPSLIFAVVKAMGYEKEVHFKFLSEKYQSVEGSTIIDI